MYVTVFDGSDFKWRAESRICERPVKIMDSDGRFRSYNDEEPFTIAEFNTLRQCMDKVFSANEDAQVQIVQRYKITNVAY
jgi:hypothetical protein